MPPVAVLPSTVTECLRVSYALTRGPVRRAPQVFLVMSRIAPLHHVYGVAYSQLDGERLYAQADAPTGPTWTSDDVQHRALFGPIDASPPPSGTGSTGDASIADSGTAAGGTSPTLITTGVAFGHTCWSDSYQIRFMTGPEVTIARQEPITLAEFSSLERLRCAQIVGGMVQVNLVSRSGEEVSGFFKLEAGTDACFLTADAVAQYLMRPYRDFYGDGFVAATRRRPNP